MRALVLFLAAVAPAGAEVTPLIGTYLGDGQRNYYGNAAPDNLRVKWRVSLGTGKSRVGNTIKRWSGAGWTGQPLVLREGREVFLIQGALDHHLRKIRARDGAVIWKVSFGDSIKGTPTFADLGGANPESRYVLIAGCRYGYESDFVNGTAFSVRGISYLTGRELWRLNVPRTHSNSRDVDASALMIGKTAVLPLENGYLAVLDPRPSETRPREGFPAPRVSRLHRLYQNEDLKTFGSELSNEGSPTLFRGKAYLAAGCGRVYSCSTGLGGLGWNLHVGGDLNSSMPLTSDGRLLLGIEHQFLPGHGGVMKLRPGKSGRAAIEWFHPLPDVRFYEWAGGLVGSPAVNDRYRSDVPSHYACFIGVEGILTVVDHQRTAAGRTVKDPLQRFEVDTPVVLDQIKLAAGSISTPLFLGNRIVVPHDKGLELFQVSPAGKLTRLAALRGRMFDATPTCWDRRIYAASRDGYLYCLGD